MERSKESGGQGGGSAAGETRAHISLHSRDTEHTKRVDTFSPIALSCAVRRSTHTKQVLAPFSGRFMASWVGVSVSGSRLHGRLWLASRQTRANTRIGPRQHDPPVPTLQSGLVSVWPYTPLHPLAQVPCINDIDEAKAQLALKRQRPVGHVLPKRSLAECLALFRPFSSGAAPLN